GLTMLNQRKAELPPHSSGSSFGSSSYMPSAFPGAERNRESNHSIVDQHLTMRGDLESEGDILVRGKVIGNIKCKLLIIDVDASVEGGIDASEVIVRGRAKGTIVADCVKLEKTAEVDCEIEQATFAAEEGARIKGSLRFKDDSHGRHSKDV